MIEKVDYIGKAINEYVDGRPEKKYETISPSALGGCLRSHFLKLRGIPATTPPSTTARVNFAVGHTWERFMAEALESQGLLEKWYQDGIDEPFYIKELNLGGTPDMLIDKDHELIIVDSKTMRSEWFWYMNKQTLEKWAADNHGYVLQQGCYIMLAQAKGIDVSKAVLAFCSKDDGFVGMELEVTLTEALKAEITERCILLNKYLKDDVLPPCECEGWKIGYCDYGDVATQTKNKKGKTVNTVCCETRLYR